MAKSKAKNQKPDPRHTAYARAVIREPIHTIRKQLAGQASFRLSPGVPSPRFLRKAKLTEVFKIPCKKVDFRLFWARNCDVF